MILSCHICGSWAIGDNRRGEILYCPGNMVNVKTSYLISETTMFCFNTEKKKSTATKPYLRDSKVRTTLPTLSLLAL